MEGMANAIGPPGKLVNHVNVELNGLVITVGVGVWMEAAMWREWQMLLVPQGNWLIMSM